MCPEPCFGAEWETVARTEDFPERLDAFVGDDLKDSRGDSTGDFDYPARIDRSVVIGDSVRRVSVWSLRILFITVAAYVGWLILGQLWRGVLPVILALIVCTVLSTPNMWLRKLKFPPALAAVTTIIIFFAAIAGVFWLIAPSIARQSQTLYYQVFDGILSVQLWLQGDPFNLDANDVDNFFNEVVGWLQNQAGTIAGEIFSGLGMATSVIITLGVVLVLTFFFLKDGDRFLSWGRQAVGETSGWHLTELLTRAWNTLAGFIRAQAIVSAVDAVFIGIGLVIVGVPMAFALSVITFVAGFIPIIGAFTAGALAVIVALVSLGFTEAVIVLIIVVAVQQLEGNILSPILQSKAMNLHPVIVLLSVTVGGTLFGIIGAFLAVPVAAMIAVAFRYFQEVISVQAGEKNYRDLTYATPYGRLAGRSITERGVQLRRDYYRNALPDQKPVDPVEETDDLAAVLVEEPTTDINELRRAMLKKRLSQGRKLTAQALDLMRRRK